MAQSARCFLGMREPGVWTLLKRGLRTPPGRMRVVTTNSTQWTCSRSPSTWVQRAKMGSGR